MATKKRFPAIDFYPSPSGMPNYKPNQSNFSIGMMPHHHSGGENLYHYLTHALTCATWWVMIQGTRGKLARNAVRGLYGKGFPSDLVSRTRTMLLALDAADSLEDLRFPPGNHLELLGGDRKGLHSLRINDQWRICFAWTQNGPTDVEIVDYH